MVSVERVRRSALKRRRLRRLLKPNNTARLPHAAAIAKAPASSHRTEPTLDQRRCLLLARMVWYTLPRHHGAIIDHLVIRAVSLKTIPS